MQRIICDIISETESNSGVTDSVQKTEERKQKTKSDLTEFDEQVEIGVLLHNTPEPLRLRVLRQHLGFGLNWPARKKAGGRPRVRILKLQGQRLRLNSEDNSFYYAHLSRIAANLSLGTGVARELQPVLLTEFLDGQNLEERVEVFLTLMRAIARVGPHDIRVRMGKRIGGWDE